MESAPGQGTAVNLRFHLAHPPSTAAPPPVPSIPASPVRSTRTVLLVEDEASVRRLTRLMIESHGCKVIEAADAESALEAFYAQPASISAVVTDIGMPGRNGYELAKELASLRPGLPVLLVSGYANHVSVPETDGGPSFEILDKPFTADEIGSRLGKLFGDRS